MVKTRMRPTTNPRTKASVWMLAAVAGLAALAGCLHEEIGTEVERDNQPPVAVLNVDRNSAWTGETFRFDASDSHDPDGNITEYRFDFGDGSEAFVTNEDGFSVLRLLDTSSGQERALPGVPPGEFVFLAGH